MDDNYKDKQIVKEICNGAIDMHIHSYPDLIPRKLNDIEVARQAKEAGMRAILLKNHFESTVGRADIVQNIIGKGIKVFGGCVLNYAVGGINPEAVDVAIKLGAKEIWMPTIDSENHILKMKTKKNNNKGICILNKKGKLTPSVYNVLKLISKSEVILGTGHLSTREIIILVKEAHKMGIEKILITHPEWWLIDMNLDLQLELSKEGAYFERCIYFLTEKGDKKGTFSTIAESIRKVGVESTVLATDFGQEFNPSPILGLVWYIRNMLKLGFKPKELDVMLKRNPSALLGIK